MSSPLRSDPSDSGRPRSIAWTLAESCVLPCAHCLARAGARSSLGGELSTMECLHVIEELAGWAEPPSLTLSGGDPLGREDLETIATHAIRRGLRVAVATPGGRLSENRIVALVHAGVERVELSLASLDAARHAALIRCAPSLDAILGAAERCQRLGLPLRIATLARAGALPDLASVAERAAALGAERLDVSLPPAGSGAFRSLDAAEHAALRPGLDALAAEWAGRLPVVLDGAGASCRISAEGKLLGGPSLGDVLGDLRHETLLDAWTGQNSFNFQARPARPDRPRS